MDTMMIENLDFTLSLCVSLPIYKTIFLMLTNREKSWKNIKTNIIRFIRLIKFITEFEIILVPENCR